jgi:two-component system response regulator YesN
MLCIENAACETGENNMSTSTLHVLLVDDEPLVKMALQKIIDWESHHYAICATASDGEEALRLQVELSPDIIITDLKMPGLDGIELIKRLKQAKYTGCVLIISNYDDYEYVREGLKLGAVDYLLKIALNKQSLLEQLQKCREILQNRGGDYRVPEVDHDLLIKY